MRARKGLFTDTGKTRVDIKFSSSGIVSRNGAKKVYVTYFDEVKSIPENGQSRYWVGGVCMPVNTVKSIDRKLNDLAKDVFGSIELVPATEFHASAIYFGKFPTRKWKMEKRIEILSKLFEILTSDKNVRRVYASIDSQKLHDPEKAAEYAFAHFCERTQMLVGKKDTTLLIGDLDTHKSAQTVREFDQYRVYGTPWEYGVNINSIVDCVHFAHSHHSRLIQLADFYLFAVSHETSSRKGDMADAFSEILKKGDYYPHRYKWWPK